MSKELKKLGINAERYKTRQALARLGLEVRYPKKFKVTIDSDHNHSISPNTLNRVVRYTSRGYGCGKYIELVFVDSKALKQTHS